MEKSVCNASPLIFLANIQNLELLSTYELFIPSQVEKEILRGLQSKKKDATQIIEYLKSNNIKPVNIKPLKDLPQSEEQNTENFFFTSFELHFGHATS